jgi:enediyne biosynthesis protein E4
VNGHVYPEVDSEPTGTSYRQRLLALLNRGDGKFEDVTDQLGPGFSKAYAGRGAAIGDFDNDGYPDILINTIDGPPALLRNQGRGGANWLQVQLKGPRTIGARVILRADDVTQMREINSQSGYLSTSSQTAYFGLGGARRVAEITIIWPDGGKQVLTGIAGCQKVVVTAPSP